jgi:hypothetical protein
MRLSKKDFSRRALGLQNETSQVLCTPDDSVVSESTQVIDKKVVGDTGFEPVTSTVCKRHKTTKKRKI